MQKGVEIRDPSSTIRIKGTGYGVRIVLPESPSEEELLELLLHIPPQACLFPIGEGAVLDFQSRACSEDLLLGILQRVVWPRSIRVLAWTSSNGVTQALVRKAGLRADEPSPALSPTHLPEGPGALVLYNSLRSGQNVEHCGDVVLWGHLNAGAEILAAGSVLGRLKGIVHAGRDGRKDVYVFAGSFETPQVRVGRRLCYADETMTWWQETVLITVEDERLIVREGHFLE